MLRSAVMSAGLCVLVVFVCRVCSGQYEKYSFRSFPESDVMPLESAYGHALEMYSSQIWSQCVKYLELSLRLHRLLKDSETHCSRSCAGPTHTDGSLPAHLLHRAACLKTCKTNLSIFSKSYPSRDTLTAFEQRIPYRYLQYVYYQVRLHSLSIKSICEHCCQNK